MITIEDAQQIVLAHAACLPAVEVPLAELMGRILAQDIAATTAVPPFPASIKDGFAVVAADGAGEREVVGEVRAGDGCAYTIQRGGCAYITTGAPVPTGADAVVQVENTSEISSESSASKIISVNAAPKPGADIRPIGFDIPVGKRVLSKGQRVGPAEIGLLASVGVGSAMAYPQPKVAVLSTGDELVDVLTGAQLCAGQIYDANRHMLLGAVRDSGGVALDLGIAGDTIADLESAIKSAMEMGANVLIRY
jgi:gephyrin